MNWNVITLCGNLTRDPELSYTPSQTAIAKFGLAVNHKWGENKEVLFVDCTAFGKTAENINKYLHKGSGALLSGRLKLDNWTAQDGTKKSKHNIVVDKCQFMPKSEQSHPKETPQEHPQDDYPDNADIIPF